MSLNPRHVRARSRALAHLQQTLWSELDRIDEERLTEEWFHWRAIGHSPADIVLSHALALGLALRWHRVDGYEHYGVLIG